MWVFIRGWNVVYRIVSVVDKKYSNLLHWQQLWLGLVAGAYLMVGMVSTTWAFTPEKSAEETVKESVEQILALIETQANDQTQEQFAKEMEVLLEPVVGYTIIARRVMGSHFNEASTEQKRKFLKVFKQSMINTYAGGMRSFAGYQVKIVPSKDDKKNTFKNTRVYLEVVAPDGTKYPMTQSLYFSRSANGWKMQNVIFNGINLGITFKTQFDQVFNEANHNMDVAIQQWQIITEESYAKTTYK